MGGARRHGAETFSIVGEGTLGESAGGRQGRSLPASTEAAAVPFRFSRTGPKGVAVGEMILRKVANAMVEGGGSFGTIPAGFTYLGQFIDHDLTFDATDVMLGEDVSPAELLQARSPSLDLDSLYGSGPDSDKSAAFYRDDRHLKVGTTVSFGGDPARAGFDLPRVGTGSTAAARRKALIPDLRNDENLAVAQTHLAFIRFHNRVVDALGPAVPPGKRLFRARRSVTKHYQWMIRHDFLPRICDRAIVRDVFVNGRKIVEPDAAPMDVPTMPVEFSVAAFRLGHSMIRRDYDWNARFPVAFGTLQFLFEFSATSGTLNGNPRLPSNWIADWRRMYDFRPVRPGLAVPGHPFNRARRIDTLLAMPLDDLPPGSFGGTAADIGTIQANLAFRNMVRGDMVKLASGQQMAAFCRSKGVQVATLTDAQVRGGSNRGAVLDGLTTLQRQRFLANTPLWFYILREAELNNGKLTGVGARIVAETFHRAIEGSRDSILRDTAWRPRFGPDDRTFRMIDLLFFAFEGNAALLAPLGD